MFNTEFGDEMTPHTYQTAWKDEQAKSKELESKVKQKFEKLGVKIETIISISENINLSCQQIHKFCIILCVLLQFF